MTIRHLLLSVTLIALAVPVMAQEADFDASERAKTAGEAARLGQGSSVFSGGTVSEVVTPFETANPPETSIGSGNIEAKQNELIAGESDASSAYRNVIDSVTLRPEYDLGTDHISVTVGDQATINAEQIAGQYFSGSVSADPACNFSEFSVLEPFERFCDVHSNMREEACTISRIVEIDRRDTWRCDVTTDDVTIICTPGEDGACAVEDLPEGNQESQCSFIEERCVAWESSIIREPETGSRFQTSGPNTSYVWSDELFSFYVWDGVIVGLSPSGEDSHNPIFIPAGEWTYHKDCAADAPVGAYGFIDCGIYRTKEGTLTEEQGPFYGLVEGRGYGWFDLDGVGGPLIWDGVLISSYAVDGAEIGGCTYRYDQSNWLDVWAEADFSWAPVYNQPWAREFWYPVQRTCQVENRCSEIERDYSCTTSDQCSSLASNTSCTRTNSTCLTSGDSGCELERSTWDCTNDLSDHAPAARIDSRIERIEDRLISSCNPSPESQGCVAEESVCSVGAEVRTIMGFPVSRDCWEYSQGFTCLAEGIEDYTDCGPFQADPSCEVIGQTCLSFVESDETVGETPAECQHWEYQYRCGVGMDLPDHCTAFNVCVGELCEGIVDEPNTDFGNAAAWLTVLDEAAKDSERSVDMQTVTLFSGTARNCKVGALSTINCCNDSGWANGILGDCSESELALMDRIQAKAAVYIGTYCSRKVLGVCLQKRRSYCTFNSQLGMVFQKEIRRLAGRGWGSAKSPNCAGLPLDQIESIDWDQIDLSEAFEDMMNDANVPTTEMVTDYLRDRLELTAGTITEGD